MGGHDVVALVSGGKDSVMAAMLAQSYGHRVVALGNLLPAVTWIRTVSRPSGTTRWPCTAT